jgi:hypothetical protein
MEREKKLSDAAAKSAVLTCQSECAAQLSQQRAQWDSERQKLFRFVADAFKQFFSAQNSIDEHTLKQLVGRARDELKSLTESNAAIRRIIGAPASQRTDEAVAQAFLHHA